MAGVDFFAAAGGFGGTGVGGVGIFGTEVGPAAGGFTELGVFVPAALGAGFPGVLAPAAADAPRVSLVRWRRPGAREESRSAGWA